MKRAPWYVGFDLGAGSGRAILGVLDNGRLGIRELYRFPNQAVQLGETLFWNTLALWGHVIDGLRVCARKGYTDLAGIGVDTWGVDYGLLARDGSLCGNPVSHRDRRTEDVERKIARRMKAADLYRETGMALTRVSTLAQLVAMRDSPARSVLEKADCLLLTPDLFRYFLCGQKKCELTIAGSSQLQDIRTGRWSDKIFRTFRLPRKIMPAIIRPGTMAGSLRPEIMEQTGIRHAPVIVVAGHDTASAAAAVPYTDPETAFISSGTWSVFGITLAKPITTPAALRCGFMNEFGLEGVLFVKNLMGLYLVENLRRSWIRQAGRLTYSQIVKAASHAKPFRYFLDPNAPVFFAAQGVEAAVGKYLRQTGQKGNPNRPEIVRALLEALAFSYRRAHQELEQLTGRRFKRLSVVGGGSRNTLLCRFTADATGLEVSAGPAEATAMGNLAIQALATGQLSSPAAIRELVIRSCERAVYRPRDTARWARNYERYQDAVAESREQR